MARNSVAPQVISKSRFLSRSLSKFNYMGRISPSELSTESQTGGDTCRFPGRLLPSSPPPLVGQSRQPQRQQQIGTTTRKITKAAIAKNIIILEAFPPAELSNLTTAAGKVCKLLCLETSVAHPIVHSGVPSNGTLIMLRCIPSIHLVSCCITSR